MVGLHSGILNRIDYLNVIKWYTRHNFLRRKKYLLDFNSFLNKFGRYNMNFFEVFAHYVNEDAALLPAFDDFNLFNDLNTIYYNTALVSSRKQNNNNKTIPTQNYCWQFNYLYIFETYIWKLQRTLKLKSI